MRLLPEFSYFPPKNNMRRNLLLMIACLLSLSFVMAQQNKMTTLISEQAVAIESKVVEWRRYLHQHPELGNREVNTMAYIAKHLEKLGLEVKTGVAKTGVVALLKGAKAGPVIALRADID